jgi:hypothetical protein
MGIKIGLAFLFFVILGGWIDRLIMTGRFSRDAKRDKTNRIG